MFQRFSSKRRAAVALSAVCVVGVVGAGYAFGAIGSGGVIQGCYDAGGNLKVVEALPCPKGYTPLAWNQQGPQGEPGLPGAKGDPGVKGDKGDPGPGGIKIVLASKTVTVPADHPVFRTECVRELFGVCVEHEQIIDHFEPGIGSAQATCPAGTQSMGGKGEGVSFGVTSTGNGPVGYSSWGATFSNNSHGEGTGRIEIRCVEVAEVTTAVAG
jgi:hypothetical protein